MNIEEAVDQAAREAKLVLLERGRNGFHGAVELKYQNDRIVTIEVKETIKK